MSTFDVVPTVNGFLRAAVFLRALTMVWSFFLSICTTFEILLLCVREMSFFGYPRLTCEFVPTIHGFASVFSQALSTVCVSSNLAAQPSEFFLRAFQK